MSGPTGKHADAVRDDAVEMAVARRAERDNLGELIAAAEAEHGPATDEEVRQSREELPRTRREQPVEGDPA